MPNLEKQIYLNKILDMHINYPIEQLFQGFCEDIIFVYKVILKLAPNDAPDYDIYAKIFESAKLKLEGLIKQSLAKYD